MTTSHFYTSNSPTGSGKTFRATSLACERISRNVKTVIIQPTIALCRQSHKDARKRFPLLKPHIDVITTDRSTDNNIAHRITSYLNDRDERGNLLFVTHAGFLRTPHWHRADTWNLMVDEALDITYHRKFRLKKYRHLLTDFFEVRPSRHPRYGCLEARCDDDLAEALAHMADDEIFEHFADFIWRLRHSDWCLFVELDAWDEFDKGRVHMLEVHGLLHPSIFQRFASVTLMGANLEDSIMYRYFDKEGCTFSTHNGIQHGLQYQQHTNGDRLLIKYLSDRKWTKTLRDMEVGRTTDSGEHEPVSIGEVYMELCQSEAAKHSGVAPLWIANRDVHDDEFEGRRLKNVPHGLNSCKEYEVCCVFSALYPPQAHRVFLQEMCGMTEREVRRAILSQTAYQACGRGILRVIDKTGVFLLIVPDIDTANDVAACYPGARIERLECGFEIPQVGRPPKYGSDMERNAARKEQNRIHQQRYRVSKKSLNHIVSADIGQTPDQRRSDIAHCLTDWAEVAPGLNATGGFALSYWLSKYDNVGQGHTTFISTDEFLTELQSRSQITRINKEANMLMSPTIFADPLRLPDWLTALGCSIEGPVRTKDRAICCRGFLLDIENGDMTQEDFAEVFPDLEFLVYSSWSHSPRAPRYRIGIPSTQHIPPEVHAMILHTIVDRLEAAGWGDALYDGRKHGVDIGKLHEAALFYLPSQRLDSFVTRYSEGRKPIDPRQWLNLICDDLLVSPPPPPPPEASRYEATPAHRHRRVEWAIDYWHRRGCFRGRGRTQFWLLALRLAQAGCDAEEMRLVLDEQAGYATNPSERRTEIEGLLRDRKVIDAMSYAA